MRSLLKSASLAAVLLVTVTAVATAQETTSGNNRTGLFGGIGLGYGILGVLDCPFGDCDTEGALSGSSRIGGTVSRSLRVAVGSNTWVKSVNSTNFYIGVLSGQVLYYPGAKDFFVLGGAGLAYDTCSGCDFDAGAGFVIGGGYDLSINKSGSLALTPYLNWIVMTMDSTPYVLQFGLGLTFN